MARLRHAANGVIVHVDEEHPFAHQGAWERIDDEPAKADSPPKEAAPARASRARKQ